ncbi:putative reverse transcriptase zinc-binding domain-containing protein [Helianthus annuus]|nr:putative reverse transcriptase zinc-binding domain-containing protein [Helianthus annuus]
MDFSNNYVFKWSKWVPKKCNILMWRAEMGRIATVDALSKRNCYNGDDVCVLCRDEAESADHLFCACPVAAEVWYRVSRWCNINPIVAFSIRDLLEVHDFINLGVAASEAFIRFNGKAMSVSDIVQEVKILGFLWYRNRSKNRNIVWNDKCSFKIM